MTSAKRISLAVVLIVIGALVTALTMRIDPPPMAVKAEPIARVATDPELADVSAPNESVRETRPAPPTAAPAEETTAPVLDVPEPPRPGCLRIVARDANGPLVGATVLVVRTGNNWLFRSTDDRERALAHVLDSAGSVEICDLEPGDHVVALEGTFGGSRQDGVRMTEDRGQIVTFDLGEGRVHGTVVGWDGAPVAEACVTLWLRGEEGLVLAWTDSAGRYDVSGVLEGSQSISAYFDGDTYGRTDDSKTIELAAGAEARVDFGLALDARRWRGVVRTASGQPVRRVGDEAPAIRFAPSAGGMPRTTSADANGAFEAQIAPGSYEVWVTPPGHQRSVALEPLEVDDADVDRDLVVPGARLAGQVVAASGAPVKGRTVIAHLEGHTYSAAYFSVPVDDEGRYTFDGLGPGDWRVGVGGDGLDAETSVRIEEGVDAVTLDLVAR